MNVNYKVTTGVLGVAFSAALGVSIYLFKRVKELNSKNEELVEDIYKFRDENRKLKRGEKLEELPQPETEEETVDEVVEGVIEEKEEHKSIFTSHDEVSEAVNLIKERQQENVLFYHPKASKMSQKEMSDIMDRTNMERIKPEEHKKVEVDGEEYDNMSDELFEKYIDMRMALLRLEMEDYDEDPDLFDELVRKYGMTPFTDYSEVFLATFRELFYYDFMFYTATDQHYYERIHNKRVRFFGEDSIFAADNGHISYAEVLLELAEDVNYDLEDGYISMILHQAMEQINMYNSNMEEIDLLEAIEAIKFHEYEGSYGYGVFGVVGDYFYAMDVKKRDFHDEVIFITNQYLEHAEEVGAI